MTALRELGTLRHAKGAPRVRERNPDNASGYLFLLPWLIGLFVITLGPMIASLALSFTDYNLLQAPEWVGWKNFARLFEDPRLGRSLVVTFVYVLVSVPIQLGVALGIAILLDRGLRGLSFYRSVYYLPSLLGASVAIAVLWRQMFGADGLVNQLLRGIGFTDLPSWISNPDTALSTIILLHIWTFGSPMIIFLAGLRQIPRFYYEAAALDGAGKATQFRRITLPLLSPIIFFNIVLQIIGAFQAFTQAFIVSNGSGGPSDSTLFFTLYMYQKGFREFDMGYASAMAWLLVVIIATFTAANFLLSRWWVFYDD